jgi:hypothetical protein
MKKNAIMMLALTAVALGAGVVFLSKRPSNPQAGSPLNLQTALLPGLSGRASDIAGFEVLRDGKSVRIDRTADGWVLPAKGNYPAKSQAAATLVRTLLESKVLEYKTTDPELFSRLSVQDPPALGTAVKAPDFGTVTPALITLIGKDGKPLAEVVLGKARQSAMGDDMSAATFAREKGKNQALLISGTFTSPVDVAEWFERGVLEIDRARFASAKVQLPASSDGALPAPLVVERKSQTEESYQVVGLPADRELKETTGPQRIVTPLASVSIDDVAPAASMDFSKASVSTITTFDGIVFSVRTIDVEGKSWINIAVAYDTSQDRSKPAAPSENADPVANQAAKTNHERALEQRASDLTKEASALHAKHSPWAYMVPSFMAEQLRATMESLLKPAGAGEMPTMPPVTTPGE